MGEALTPNFSATVYQMTGATVTVTVSVKSRQSSVKSTVQKLCILATASACGKIAMTRTVDVLGVAKGYEQKQ